MRSHDTVAIREEKTHQIHFPREQGTDQSMAVTLLHSSTFICHKRC